MKKVLSSVFAVMTGLLLAGSCYALDYDFNGTFQQDNDVLRINFTVGGSSASNVTVFSSSWLSGDGGGFDPILAIWSESGALLYQQDDGGNVGSTLSNGTSYNHGVWDSFYEVLLNPGNYIVTVAQYSNFANSTSLSDGFWYDDNPNFTYDGGYGGATQEYFNGVWDDNDPRTGNWAFHLLNVAQADVVDPVPEPSTMLLLGAGLLGLGFIGRKRIKA